MKNNLEIAGFEKVGNYNNEKDKYYCGVFKCSEQLSWIDNLYTIKTKNMIVGDDFVLKKVKKRR